MAVKDRIVIGSSNQLSPQTSFWNLPSSASSELLYILRRTCTAINELSAFALGFLLIHPPNILPFIPS